MKQLPAAHWDRLDAKSRNGWYHHEIPNTMGFDAHFDLYRSIAQWIPENIHYARRNTRWTKMGDCIYVQFKKEKDYHWFMLRWA